MSKFTSSPWNIFFFLLALSGISFFIGLSSRTLWGADETRYATTVREMVESGDWISPTFNHHDDGEKPPLFYWMGAVVAKIRGQADELSVFIPSAIAGFFCLLFVFLIGKLLFNHLLGLFSAFVLATMAGFSWQCRTGQMDAVLTAFVLGSIFYFLKASEEKNAWRQRLALITAYILAGLAWLTKGPVAIVLIVIPVLSFWWLCLERRFIRLELWWGIPLFLFIAAPWYIALAQRQPNGPELVKHLLWNQNVGRYLDFWDKTDRITTYFQIFADLLPWTPLFFFALYATWKKPSVWKKQQVFLIAWFLLGLTFFLFSSSRRSAYLIPLFPAIAMLCASVWNFAWNKKTTLYGLAFLLALQGGFYAWGIPFLDAKKEKKSAAIELARGVPLDAQIYCYKTERPWVIYYLPRQTSGYFGGEGTLENLLSKGHYILFEEPDYKRLLERNVFRYEVVGYSEEGRRLYILHTRP